jgi:hypothetical protein
MLSDIARLMFFLLRSNEMNISHAQKVILMSSYYILAFCQSQSAGSRTLRTSLFSSSGLQV